MKKIILAKRISICLLISLSCLLTKGQTFCISNQHTLGGSGDDVPNSIIKTPDGYLICGHTNSKDGSFNVPVNHDFDGFIAKFDDNNNLIWQHSYGGKSYDDFWNVKLTNDGGFIVVGNTSSNDGDVSGNHGGKRDVWVVKFNSLGLIQWQHCYGGKGNDNAWEINIVPEGYVVVGTTNSNNNGDVFANHGGYDAWLLIISQNGNVLNSYCYGGSGDEDLISCLRNTDGTATFVASTTSNDGQVSGNHGSDVDAWLVNINSSNIIWQKCFGGSSWEHPHNLVRTSDGNMVLCGGGYSLDGDFVSTPGWSTAFLMKFNPITGNVLWKRAYKKDNIGTASLGSLATSDGGILSMGAIGNPFVPSTHDAYIFKVNSNGNMVWEKILGGTSTDNVTYWYSGIEVNNKYIVPIATRSHNGDVLDALGGDDAWIVTLGNCDISAKSTTRTNVQESVMMGQKISVYPNPSSNQITIINNNMKMLGTISVYDLTGKIIYQKFISNSQTIVEIRNFSAGVYYLKSNQFDTRIKFVRE